MGDISNTGETRDRQGRRPKVIGGNGMRGPSLPESEVVASIGPPPSVASSTPPVSTAGAVALGKAQYCFTLTTSTRQRPVGEMQGGYRVDFDFWRDEGAISCLPGTVLAGATQELLKTARIVSGSDWAFVSQFGIVDFDSRVTARLGGTQPEEQCLMAGRFRGRADLAKARSCDGAPLFENPPDRNTVVNRWKAGLPQKSYIPLVLAVTFEVPIENFDNTHAEIYDKVRLLGQSLLIGSGSAELLGGPYGAVGEIKLDLFSVEPAEMTR